MNTGNFHTKSLGTEAGGPRPQEKRLHPSRVEIGGSNGGIPSRHTGTRHSEIWRVEISGTPPVHQVGPCEKTEQNPHKGSQIKTGLKKLVNAL